MGRGPADCTTFGARASTGCDAEWAPPPITSATCVGAGIVVVVVRVGLVHRVDEPRLERPGVERPAGADDAVREREAPAVLREREQEQARQVEGAGQQQDGAAAFEVGILLPIDCLVSSVS